jgi:hypothetical protein
MVMLKWLIVVVVVADAVDAGFRSGPESVAVVGIRFVEV